MKKALGIFHSDYSFPFSTSAGGRYFLDFYPNCGEAPGGKAQESVGTH